MSRIGLASAATAAVLVTASMAQGNAFELDGFYAGAHLGYLDVKADSSSSSGSISGDGTMGGLQAGYNVVNGNLMWGIETDLSLTSASPCCNIRVGPMATLRPRIGFAVDDWLLFVTGGIAASQFEDFDAFHGEFGWTVGAGVERMVGDLVGVKLEYRYMRFDNADFDPHLGSSNTGIDLEVHTIMAGVNFHF